MCFSPSDESGFFDALRAGRFDAKAVCGTIDAMKATASVAEDKAMITDRIEAEVGGCQTMKRLWLLVLIIAPWS